LPVAVAVVPVAAVVRRRMERIYTPDHAPTRERGFGSTI